MNSKTVTDAVIRAYERLDDQDRYYVDRDVRRIIKRFRNLGEKSAIELVGKIGIVLAKNNQKS